MEIVHQIFSKESSEQKRILRRKVKKIREGLSIQSIEQMSNVISDKIRTLVEFENADAVFLYMDLPGEVQMRRLTEICLKARKRVAVPRIEGRQMHFYGIESFGHLVTGRMNILEPDPDYCPCMDKEENALMVLPGLAFDRALHRVGYGGGFYDRYLSEHRKHCTVAAAFECQIFDAVPFDERDIRPQMLVTEKEVYSLNL